MVVLVEEQAPTVKTHYSLVELEDILVDLQLELHSLLKAVVAVDHILSHLLLTSLVPTEHMLV